MFKKSTLALTLLVLTFIIVESTQVAMTFSTGPPAGYTGAPMEFTCSDGVGCHGGVPMVNAANADFAISDAAGNAVTSYTPGDTYTIDVTLNGAAAGGCYGFQLLNLDPDGNTVGTFNAVAGTKVITSGARTYIEHDTPTTTGTWSFTWTAPTANLGDVEWYLGANIANCNGASSGDQIFTAAKTMDAPPPCPVEFDLVQAQPGILFFDCNYDADEPRLWLKISNFSGPDAPYCVSAPGGEFTSSIANPGDTLDYYFTQSDLDGLLASVTVDNGSCLCTPYDSINIALAGFPVAAICFDAVQCASNVEASYATNADLEPIMTCSADGSALELTIPAVTGGSGAYTITTQGGTAVPSALNAGAGFTWSLTQADIDALNSVLIIDDGAGCTNTIDLNGYLKNAVLADICTGCATASEPFDALPTGVCDGVAYQQCYSFTPSAEGITATVASDLGYSDTQVGGVGDTELCFDIVSSNATCAVIAEAFTLTATCDSLGYVTCNTGAGTPATVTLADGTPLTDFPLGSVDIYPDPSVYAGYQVVNGTCGTQPILNVAGSTCPPNFTITEVTATVDGCAANNDPAPVDGAYSIVVTDPLAASPCAFAPVTLPAVDIACTDNCACPTAEVSIAAAGPFCGAETVDVCFTFSNSDPDGVIITANGVSVTVAAGAVEECVTVTLANNTCAATTEDIIATAVCVAGNPLIEGSTGNELTDINVGTVDVFPNPTVYNGAVAIDGTCGTDPSVDFTNATCPANVTTNVTTATVDGCAPTNDPAPVTGSVSFILEDPLAATSPCPATIASLTATDVACTDSCDDSCPFVSISITDDSDVCSGATAEICFDFTINDSETVTVSANGVSATGAAGVTTLCVDIPLTNTTCDPITVPVVVMGSCSDGDPLRFANLVDINGSTVGVVTVYPDPAVYTGFVAVDGDCASNPTLDVSGSTCPPDFVINTLVATVDGCAANNDPAPVNGSFEIVVSDPHAASPCAIASTTLPAVDIACDMICGDCPEATYTVGALDDVCDGATVDVCVQWAVVNPLGATVTVNGVTEVAAAAATETCVTVPLTNATCAPITEALSLTVACADGTPTPEFGTGTELTAIALGSIEVFPAPDVYDGYIAVAGSCGTDPTLDISNSTCPPLFSVTADVPTVDGCSATGEPVPVDGSYTITITDPLAATSPCPATLAPLTVADVACTDVCGDCPTVVESISTMTVCDGDVATVCFDITGSSTGTSIVVNGVSVPVAPGDTQVCTDVTLSNNTCNPVSSDILATVTCFDSTVLYDDVVGSVQVYPSPTVYDGVVAVDGDAGCGTIVSVDASGAQCPPNFVINTITPAEDACVAIGETPVNGVYEVVLSDPFAGSTPCPATFTVLSATDVACGTACGDCPNVVPSVSSAAACDGGTITACFDFDSDNTNSSIDVNGVTQDILTNTPTVCVDVVLSNATCNPVSETITATITCFDGSTILTGPIGNVSVYPAPSVYAGAIAVDGTCGTDPSIDLSAATCPPTVMMNVITATVDGCAATNDPAPVDGEVEYVLTDPFAGATPCPATIPALTAVDIACLDNCPPPGCPSVTASLSETVGCDGDAVSLCLNFSGTTIGTTVDLNGAVSVLSADIPQVCETIILSNATCAASNALITASAICADGSSIFDNTVGLITVYPNPAVYAGLVAVDGSCTTDPFIDLSATTCPPDIVTAVTTLTVNGCAETNDPMPVDGAYEFTITDPFPASPCTITPAVLTAVDVACTTFGCPGDDGCATAIAALVNPTVCDGDVAEVCFTFDPTLGAAVGGSINVNGITEAIVSDATPLCIQVPMVNTTCDVVTTTIFIAAFCPDGSLMENTNTGLPVNGALANVLVYPNPLSYNGFVAVDGDCLSDPTLDISATTCPPDFNISVVAPTFDGCLDQGDPVSNGSYLITVSDPFEGLSPCPATFDPLTAVDIACDDLGCIPCPDARAIEVSDVKCDGESVDVCVQFPNGDAAGASITINGTTVVVPNGIVEECVNVVLANATCLPTSTDIEILALCSDGSPLVNLETGDLISGTFGSVEVYPNPAVYDGFIAVDGTCTSDPTLDVTNTTCPPEFTVQAIIPTVNGCALTSDPAPVDGSYMLVITDPYAGITPCEADLDPLMATDIACTDVCNCPVVTSIDAPASGCNGDLVNVCVNFDVAADQVTVNGSGVNTSGDTFICFDYALANNDNACSVVAESIDPEILCEGSALSFATAEISIYPPASSYVVEIIAAEECVDGDPMTGSDPAIGPASISCPMNTINNSLTTPASDDCDAPANGQWSFYFEPVIDLAGAPSCAVPLPGALSGTVIVPPCLDCNNVCGSDAGTLSISNLSICDGESSLASLSGYTLDPGQTAFVVFHDSPNPAVNLPTTVYDISSATAGLVTLTAMNDGSLPPVFYATGIIAMDVGGSPDFTDPCLEITNTFTLTTLEDIEISQVGSYTCNSDNSGYSISVLATGGDGNYALSTSSGTLSQTGSGVFTISDIPNNSLVFVTGTDGSGCTSNVLQVAPFMCEDEPTYEIGIEDPCTCLSDLSPNGLANQFSEYIQVMGAPNSIWTITINSGLYDMTGSTLYPTGQVMTSGVADGYDNDNDGAVDEPDENIYSTLTGVHDSGMGYTINVSNGSNNLSIGNLCEYPELTVGMIPGSICLEDGVAGPFMVQSVDPITGQAVSGTFTLSGAGILDAGSGIFTVDPTIVGVGVVSGSILFTSDEGCISAPSSFTINVIECNVGGMCEAVAGTVSPPSVTEACTIDGEIFAGSVSGNNLNYDYIYVLVNNSDNQVYAYSANGYFPVDGFPVGDYCVYGISYLDGASDAPNLTVGTFSQLESQVGVACLDISDNCYPVTITECGYVECNPDGLIFCTEAQTPIEICLGCDPLSGVVIDTVISLYWCNIDDVQGDCFTYTPLPNMEVLGSEDLTVVYCNPDGTCDTTIVTIAIGDCGVLPICEDTLYTCTEPVTTLELCLDCEFLTNPNIYIDTIYSVFSCQIDQQSDLCFDYTPIPGVEDFSPDNVIVTYCDMITGDCADIVYVIEIADDCGPQTACPTYEGCAEPLEEFSFCMDCELDDPGITITSASSLFNCSINNLAGGCFTYVPLPMMDLVGADTIVIEYIDSQGNPGTNYLYMTIGNCDGGGIAGGPIENEGGTSTEDTEELALILEDDEIDINNDGNIHNIDVISNDLILTNIHSIELTFSPINGEAYFNSDHQLVYQPATNFEGLDNMIYEVCYNNGLCDEAVIYLNVRRDDPIDLQPQCLLEIYNGVSPNNDGLNDAFTVNGLECYETNKLSIFSKDSEKLYQVENYQNDWKGTNMYDNSDLEEGTYYYLIELTRNEKSTISKGFIEIHR